MSLWDYVQGNLYGEEAHKLETEAMRDPFLQDAIDGYDRVMDRPADHLKKLDKRLSRRTKKGLYSPQAWGVAAGILLIVGLSIFFFLSGRSNFMKDTAFVEHHADSIISKYTKDLNDSLLALGRIPNNSPLVDNKAADAGLAGQAGVNKKVETIATPENATRERIRSSSPYTLSSGETRAILDRNADREEDSYESSSDNTLSTDEVREILSNYRSDESKGNDRLSQPPHPARGSQSYNDYIAKNRSGLEETGCGDQHGKVILLFHVNRQGRPVDISVLRSLCPEADSEAVRLLQSGPNWTASESFARLEVNF